MPLILIPKKSYKKCFVLFVTLTLTIFKPKAAKVLIHNSLSHLKPISHLMPIFPVFWSQVRKAK